MGCSTSLSRPRLGLVVPASRETVEIRWDLAWLLRNPSPLAPSVVVDASPFSMADVCVLLVRSEGVIPVFVAVRCIQRSAQKTVRFQPWLSVLRTSQYHGGQ